MSGRDEWKKAFYEDEPRIWSKKIFWIVVVFIVIGVIASIVFLFPAKVIDIGIVMTAEDITYSAGKGEMSEIYQTIINNHDHLASTGKEIFGYGFEDLISGPRDTLAFKAAALSHVLIHTSLINIEYGFLDGKGMINPDDVLSLPIDKVNENDNSKENLLLVISNLIKIEELYKEKGLAISETTINRLNVLYSYFEVVEIEGDVINDPDNIGELLPSILKGYNSFFNFVKVEIP